MRNYSSTPKLEKRAFERQGGGGFSAVTQTWLRTRLTLPYSRSLHLVDCKTRVGKYKYEKTAHLSALEAGAVALVGQHVGQEDAGQVRAHQPGCTCVCVNHQNYETDAYEHVVVNRSIYPAR